MQLKVSKRKHLEPVEISLTGAKNALLHLMFASLLPIGTTRFLNVPTSLRDYRGICDILRYLGTEVNELDEKTVELTSHIQAQSIDLSIDYTKKTRTSLMLLGALSKQVKSLRIGYPGGCSFAEERPFDIHVDGLRALGAAVKVDEYHIEVTKTQEKNAEFRLKYPSVGASINLMLYAARGKSIVKLHNIALEPEVVEVASFINQCGGKVRIDHKKRAMQINGSNMLKGVSFAVMYDRIQTMSYAALAYLHHLDVVVLGVSTKEYIDAPLKVLTKIGARWQFNAAKQSIQFFGSKSKLVKTKITAEPYPAFPTDLQPIFAVMLSAANGESSILDTVYPERVKYVAELQKIGFPILFDGKQIKITPLNQCKKPLASATMKSFDLRAGMAVIMAASLCEKVCYITHAEQVFRGYERLLENMTHFMHIAVATEYYEK